MAEVPPHLLERAKARRAAMGQGGDAAPAAPTSSAAPAAAASTPAVAASAAAAPPAPPKGGGAPASPAAPPPPRGLQFAKMARVLLMAGVPVWAFFFAGTFITPKSNVETEAARGARLYSANCSTCHLANGAGKDAGGVGRPLWKGNAEKTFPQLEQQLAFVRHGSCGVGVKYGNPAREGGQHAALGGMPAFPDTALTEDDLVAIVKYERTVLSDAEYPTTLPGVTEVTSTIAPTTENVCAG